MKSYNQKLNSFQMYDAKAAFDGYFKPILNLSESNKKGLLEEDW